MDFYVSMSAWAYNFIPTFLGLKRLRSGDHFWLFIFLDVELWSSKIQLGISHLTTVAGRSVQLHEWIPPSNVLVLSFHVFFEDLYIIRRKVANLYKSNQSLSKSEYQSINQSINQSVSQSTNQSINQLCLALMTLKRHKHTTAKYWGEERIRRKDPRTRTNAIYNLNITLTGSEPGNIGEMSIQFNKFPLRWWLVNSQRSNATGIPQVFIKQT